MKLYYDSDSGIDLVTPTKQNDCTKHIDIHYHFIKEIVEAQQMKVLPCCTHNNKENILTKRFTRNKHKKFTLNLGFLDKA